MERLNAPWVVGTFNFFGASRFLAQSMCRYRRANPHPTDPASVRSNVGQRGCNRASNVHSWPVSSVREQRHDLVCQMLSGYDSTN